MARIILAVENFDADCSAMGQLQGEQLKGGAVLLQLKGTFDSSAARLDAEDGTFVGNVAEGLQDVQVLALDGSQPGSQDVKLAHGVGGEPTDRSKHVQDVESSLDTPAPKEAVEEYSKYASRGKKADSAEPAWSDSGTKTGARKVVIMEQAAKASLRSARVSLSERGYLDVARLHSNREMEGFVKRVISEMALEVVDPGGLAGVVPFYSGRKHTQSLAALKAELRSTARKRHGWLAKDVNG